MLTLLPSGPKLYSFVSTKVPTVRFELRESLLNLSQSSASTLRIATSSFLAPWAQTAWTSGSSGLSVSKPLSWLTIGMSPRDWSFARSLFPSFWPKMSVRFSSKVTVYRVCGLNLPSIVIEASGRVLKRLSVLNSWSGGVIVTIFGLNFLLSIRLLNSKVFLSGKPLDLVKSFTQLDDSKTIDVVFNASGP